MCSTRIHPDFRVPTSNLGLLHPGREKRTTSIHLCREGVSPPAPLCRGGWGGLFQRRSQAWPWPQELSSPPTPHFSRELPKPAQDRIMCTGYTTKRHQGPTRGSREEQREVARGPASEKRQVVSITLFPSFQPCGAGRGLMSGLNIVTLPPSGKSWTQLAGSTRGRRKGVPFTSSPSPKNSALPI